MSGPGPDGLAWQQVEVEADGLARAVQARFAAHPHHVLATLHADGRPRVSGTNVLFGDGCLWVGSMPGARKAADLRRDPRCALHSAPLDEELPDAAGDARVEAVAVPLDDATAAHLLDLEYGDGPRPDGGEFFELRVTALSLVTVEGDELRVRSWSPGAGSGETLRR